MLYFFFVQLSVIVVLNPHKGKGMVLTYGTVEGIDKQVANGLPIGYTRPNIDVTKIPKLIGDWQIRVIPDSVSFGTGILIATPTNKRTRLIYNKGRITWLIRIGFNKTNASKYSKVSNRFKTKWDKSTAMFVNELIEVDLITIELIQASREPRRECLDNGIYTTLNKLRIIEACEIALEIKI